MSMRSNRFERPANRDRVVVVYCRVSSREQAEGYSIEAQLRLCQELVARETLRLAHDPFVEVHSAKEEGRPVFQEMQKFLRKNTQVGGVVGHKIDRLGRNLGDLATLFEELKLRPWLVDQAFPDNAQGRLAYNMLGVFAKYYSENLREEVRKGQGEKARQGGTPFHAPHGYVHRPESGDVPALDRERRAGLLQIFDDAATGRFTLDVIQDRAWRRGYRFSEKQARVPRSTLQRILKNPYYAGEIHFRGDVHEGEHEALVTRELFGRVQRALERTPGGYGNPAIPYRGLLRCACGRQVTQEEIIKEKNGVEKGRYVYYRCARYKACKGARLTLAELEDAFGQAVEALGFSEEHITTVRDAITLARGQESDFREKALKRLEERAREASAKLDALLLEKISGTLTEDEFVRVRDVVRREESDARIALEAHSKAPGASLDMAERAVELAKTIPGLWLRQNREERETLLNVLCSNFVLDGTSLRPEWRRPFDLFLERPLPTKTRARD